VPVSVTGNKKMRMRLIITGAAPGSLRDVLARAADRQLSRT
jgi:hypothetical protein